MDPMPLGLHCHLLIHWWMVFNFGMGTSSQLQNPLDSSNQQSNMKKYIMILCLWSIMMNSWLSPFRSMPGGISFLALWRLRKTPGWDSQTKLLQKLPKALNLRKGMLSFKIPAFEISKSKQIKHRNEDLPNKTSSNTYRTWERNVDGFCSLRSLLAWTWLLWSAHSSSAFALHLVKESDKYTILN